MPKAPTTLTLPSHPKNCHAVNPKATQPHHCDHPALERQQQQQCSPNNFAVQLKLSHFCSGKIRVCNLHTVPQFSAQLEKSSYLTCTGAEQLWACTKATPPHSDTGPEHTPSPLTASFVFILRFFWCFSFGLQVHKHAPGARSMTLKLKLPNCCQS